MQAYGHNDLPDQNQGQIFEHLSAFIQLFRRSVTLLELIATLITKDQDYTPLVQKIKLVFEQLEPLKLNYQDASGPKVIRQITYHRFTCRLLEILYLYASKYKETPQSHPLVCFQQTLKEIQIAIKQSEENQSFIDIIKRSQLSFLKFLVNCKKSAKKIDEQTEKRCQLAMWQLKKAYLHDRKRRKILKVQSLCQQLESDSSEEQENVTLPTTSLTTFNKTPTFNKDLACIQNRFDLFKGMDLDFSSFRCDFFMAKNSKESFFRQWMKRNQGNKKLITTYYDDFYLFQKKKTNKENKRNKLKNLYENNIPFLYHSKEKNTTAREMIHSLYNTNNLTAESEEYNSLNHNLNQNNTISMEDSSQDNLVTNNKISGKKMLAMKNVELSLGKGKIKPPKGTQNFIKNFIKPQPINQSYYNELSPQKNNSLDFLHIKLRLESQPKTKTKLKTQNSNKNEKSVSVAPESQTTKSNDPISLAIKSRSTFKGKYLAINCASKKNDADLKRKIFHHGASITKIGFKNGYKIENNRKIIATMH